jgi:hypothetical protein
MTTRSARYIPAVVLVFSAIAISVVGIISHLPTSSIVIMSLVVLFLAILSLRYWRPVGETGTQFWIFLAVGILFFLGGTVGLVRLLSKGWQWSEGLPLAVPLGLGLCVIWFTFKTRWRATP